MSLQDQHIYSTTLNLDKKQINYLSRDYQAIRQDLITYLKNFYPDQWQDFNVASPGMAMVDLNAYVGDILSYAIDKKYNELFLDGVQRRSSVYRMAKTFGYTPPGVRPSLTIVDMSVDVPVTASGPNTSYLPLFRAGVKISGGGQVFETTSDIDFSNDYSDGGIPNRVIEPVKDSNENITKYVITKREKVTAGASKVIRVEITADDVKPFYTYTLPDTNPLSIESIIILPGLDISDTPTYEDFNDSDYKFWEVDHLPDNKVFTEDDTQTGVNGVKIGTYLTVAKRFEKEFLSNGKCKIILGGGEAGYNAYAAYLTDATEVKNCSSPPILTMENILNNDALGEKVTANSTMFIKYRVGGGPLSNIGSNTLTNISNINAVILGTQASLNEAVLSSAKVNNPIPAIGGLGLPTVQEIASNISANFAAQDRCITLEDYISRSYQLPGKFGAPFRIYGEVEDNKIKMYILSKNAAGQIMTTSTNAVKNNLAEYLAPYRSINDFVEINDGRVINLQAEVDLFVDKSFNASEVKLNALNELKSFFDINKWQMNQTIYISQITDILRDVPGVINVVDMRFYNMTGGGYSVTESPQATGSKEIIPDTGGYRTRIELSDNSIIGLPISMFELKYINKDALVRVG